MSLDIYLTLGPSSSPQKKKDWSGVFVREHGRIKEISRSEWDEKFPECEPITLGVYPDDEDGEEVYWGNITHNLNEMAKEAGIYECVWRPNENGNNITHAHQLIEPLRRGIKFLKDDPKRFEKFNPSNGWGTYKGLVSFLEEYLDACEKYPSAKVYASR